MKFNKLFYTTFIATVIVTAGCKKDSFDINKNPDDITDASITASVLLPGALQATSSQIAGEWWFIGWWMGHGARSGSYQTFNEEETYQFTNDFHVSVWTGLYSNANAYNLVINKAHESGAGIYEAIGRTMKAHNFQMLVDIYNNVPYSEAFNGAGTPTPKYDKGIDIYKDIFKQLDTAIIILSDEELTDASKNPEIESTDLVYAGDVHMWMKFINTLRLRMIIHLHSGMDGATSVPGIDIAEQVSKITEDGFIGAGESALVNPGFSGTKPQPYFRFFDTDENGTGARRDWARASEYAIKYYNWDGDPRIDQFYVAPTGGHKGIPFGTPSGDDAPTGSALSTVRGPGLSPDGAESRAWILTSFESYFLQAEARHRGVISSGPSALDLVNAGITESFVFLGLTEDDAIDYMNYNATYPDVDYSAEGGGLETILSQKWFALNSIAPYEIWTDYRRTGMVYGAPGGFDAGPTISIDPGNTATSIPVRLFYPQNEYNYNATNVEAEGTIDVFTNKIFWDLN